MTTPQPAQSAATQRPARRFRSVYVRRVARLTPHLVRVTFAGDELSGFQVDAPVKHIKLVFPAPSQDAPATLTAGPNGLVDPLTQQKLLMRTYTPRHFDPEALELDVDFVLHGDGPAVNWATTAREGAALMLAGPGGGYVVNPAIESYLIVGDASALPAIGTLVETLPATAQAQVYVEIPEAADALALTSAAQINVTWLHAGSARQAPSASLIDVVRQTAIPDGAVLVACEATAMRTIRKYLLEERHVPTAALYTRGYWKIGEVNHPDHDTGEDA
ncbi:MAG: siderophore-interacting protein [Ktedonobacterales bacterium]